MHYIDRNSQDTYPQNWPKNKWKAIDLKSLNIISCLNGRVRIGKAIFLNSLEESVAIKYLDSRLDEKINGVSKAYIMRLDISKLSEELCHFGIELPAIDLVKVDKQWVLLSKLYAENGRSKISLIDNLLNTSVENIERAACITAAEINAGFIPTRDILKEVLVENGVEKIIPIDIDYFADEYQERYKKPQSSLFDDLYFQKVAEALEWVGSEVLNKKQFVELVLPKIRNQSVREKIITKIKVNW